MDKALHISTWLKTRWQNGTSLRYVVGFVIVVSVTVPAITLMTIGQYLTEKSQKILRERGELALMALGTVTITESLWVQDSGALNAAAERIVENPQVVAVRIDDALNSTSVTRVRPDLENGFKSLEEMTAAGLLDRHISSINRSGVTVGSLVIWFDSRLDEELLQKYRHQMLLLIAFQIAMTLGVLIPVLVARVMRPIERLKQHASALANLTDDGHQADFVWTRQDELGLLGQHLGQVQHQLHTLFAELKSKNEQLKQMVMYDRLTGAVNRSLFIDLVQREILHAHRTQQKFGVFFIDLDRFKAVNDTMGHAAGDVVLVEVVRRISAVLREVDVVCRQSGDEFLVLLRNITHWDTLGEMADRVIKALETPVAVDTRFTSVSASIGIALFPDDAQDFDTLIKNADVAMYHAKRLGRSRYIFFHTHVSS
jgi:diguanylate cyclase (GGDEF)-like protein